MPRVSEAEKRNSHSRIVNSASRLIRDNGIETTTLSEVMNTAGLTQGGFYRHFSSKEDLVAAAFRAAVDEVTAEMENSSDAISYEDAQVNYIRDYLSDDHLENRGAGCPLAALGSELTRADPSVRDAADHAVARVAALLEDKGAPDTGYARLAMLVGAVTLARLSSQPAQKQAILAAATLELTKSG